MIIPFLLSINLFMTITMNKNREILINGCGRNTKQKVDFPFQHVHVLSSIDLVSNQLIFISMSSSSDIEIISLSSEHRESVINLLMSSFFVQEPLNAMLQFDIPHEPLTWINHIIDGSLRDQCSFVAIERTNLHENIVGVILNRISDCNHKEETFVVPSEKLNFIISLIDKLSNGYDLFELYKTDRLFHCDIVNIDESQRRKNLSNRLITTSENKARQLGMTGAFVVCSSLFSRKAFERQGYQIINEILYSEYGNGRLTDMGEHDRCTLLAKHL